MDHHTMTGMTMSYDGPLLLIGCAVNLALAAVLSLRLVGPRGVRRDGGFGPVTETGHLLTAAGMAYMYAPAGWQRLSPTALAWVFLTAALVFLAMNLTTGHVRPARWACCNLLMAETAAMAYMFAYPAWESADLTNGLRVLFTAVTAVAAGRIALRTRLPLPAGATTTTIATRLVMGGGMLVALTLVQPM